MESAGIGCELVVAATAFVEDRAIVVCCVEHRVLENNSLRCEVSARNLEVVACLSVCALSASTFSQDQGGCAPFTFLEAIVVRHPGKDSELRASFEFTNFECRLNFR